MNKVSRIQYEEQKTAYDKAVAEKRRLCTVVYMNKQWDNGGMSKRSIERRTKIEQAQKALAVLVIPTKPEPVISGFEVTDAEGIYGGFVPTQDEAEAKEQAAEYFDKFTIKAIYTV